MALLQDILYKVSLQATTGRTDIEISSIAFDSRAVKEATVFVAVQGTSVDGHQYIHTAIEKGAVAIVCQSMPDVLVAGITYVQVQDSAEALGVMACNYYSNPSSKLHLIGVTGTNGKTTVATLMFQLFRSLGYSCGLLSTVENKIDDEVIPSTHTTPDPIALNALLAQMVEAGCSHAFMEVSSHAAVQRRIAGLDFDGALFTNITHDHLDYHKTFDEYIRAKKLFFDGLGKHAFAVVNNDDKRGMVMLQNTKATKYTYSLKSLADFKGKIISNTLHGLEMEVNGIQVWFRLIGAFNAYNLLAVCAAAVLMGEEWQKVLQALSALAPARGRFDQIRSESGIIGIVDYAHTPDALENVLNTINDLSLLDSKIITVVGCGGNRDTTKRPKMADIACKLSTTVILTSDNPRNEDPDMILAEMKAGVSKADEKKTIVLSDRREAIKLAVALAGPNDVILLAGKGHETYQEIKGVKHHFDDKEELLNAFQIHSK